MKGAGSLTAVWESWFSSRGREQRIKDYLILSKKLVWRRQASFIVAAILSAFYFDPVRIIFLYGIVVITEFLDERLARQAEVWDGKDPVIGRAILIRIARNTVLSAVAICAFIIEIAIQQKTGGHFMSLFFLFSASVFAAMYNSQMIGILVLRLSIYAIGFIFIAFLDIVRYAPELNSPIWLEFFTIIFVLFFVGDMSLKFFRDYQLQLKQMRVIKAENRRSKAALAAKSQFLATVSHELRTPLTSIIGSLELVNGGAFGELPEKSRPPLEIAARNSRRLATLIEDLLDMQKIEAGEMVFQFNPIDANALVREAIDATAGYASKLDIHVIVVPCRDDSRIAGDRNRLIQVLNNLLSNALKFSEKGGTVTVRVERTDETVRISIEDEGLGIPKDAEERVFGKFSQVDSSDVRRVGGTGLGLNITKQIVERHNATISYESELGVGSTFYVVFDALTDAAVEEDDLDPLVEFD
ncbi:sensor histidine kinase [Salipiger sp. IMCC34102]|uniref:sensor histidine kinase n=1 Tax=Salipiger sp. IMCC34102 TaxID=2510647 RepID=UPI00101CBF3F|nr:ATP-binding protein [Salipiger sp. IMCC34102]RYH01454.1 sensor histidine kinase [Salipiger sp. IMCC34102]